MSTPAKINFKIYQGSTFQETLRWESSVKMYKPITSILKSAPVVITAVGHSIPVGWRVKLTNILGMTELNSATVYHTVTLVTEDNIVLNDINSLGYKDYISGGVVEYNLPTDLTNYTARMQIRTKVSSDDIIHELTTENGGIIINTDTSTINLNISASNTAAFSFSAAVYSIELVSSINVVVPYASGNISLIKEVTR